MRYRRLGHGGLFVSEFCLRTMTFGGGDDPRGQIGQLKPRDADELVKVAPDAGINFFDSATRVAETLEAQDTLVRQGSVDSVGLSNCAAQQVMKAVGFAAARQLSPIVLLQAHSTLAGRDIERKARGPAERQYRG